LKGGLSPRLDGIDLPHAQLLAELADDVPPIVVHRSSMRVVDGMHRWHAALSRGDQFIPVVYFEGSDAEAFLAAIRLNVVHGMPLSAGDRSAAAERILDSHPHWSDRRIASACGVATKSVAMLRQRSTDDRSQVNTRIGRDGRRHPISTVEGRSLAAEIMREHPDASLRAVARQAGISVGTAMDVRRRLVAAVDTAPTPTRAGAVAATSAEAEPGAPPSVSVNRAVLERLINDPSLRYNERGRALLRLVSATLVFMNQSDMVADDLPGHCRDPLRTVAAGCAAGWQDFGHRLA
jgi:ParB-like chromosome segregation protein Spo0J